MAKGYSIDLSALFLNSAGTAGYYTVGKNKLNKDLSDDALTATTAKDSVASGDTVASVAVSNDTYTLSYRAGSTAVSIASDEKNANQTWRITTGAGSDTIDAGKLGEGTTINAGNGNNVVTGGKGMTITTGSGKDTITAGEADTINSGAGNDSIVVRAAADVVLNAGDGKDTIDVTGTGASVNAGAGDDVITLGTNAKDASVDGGAGNDSIVAGSSATITLGAGTDTVSLGASADVTLTDYVFGTDVIQGTTAITATQDSLKSGDVFGTSGTLTSGSQKVTVNKTNGFYAVELSTVAADKTTKQAYAWATEDGGTVNASSYKSAVIMTGANNDENADLLLGGTGNDTIVAGSYDSVYGGKGADSIVLTGDYDTVGLYNDGSKDSVTGFSGGFDDEDTTLYFNGSLANAKFSLGSANTVVTNGKSTLTISSDGTTATSVGKLKVTNGSTSYNVQVLGKNASSSLDGDATAVFGEKSTLELVNDLGDTVVDLGNTGKYGDTRYYSGITAVSLAADNNSDVVLVGAANAANTLVGGAGATSLYGGGSSKDLLVGGTGADTFFYGKGDGRDTVSGYHYDANDETTSDTLVFTTTDFSKITREDGTLKLTFGSGTNNTLTVTTTDEVDTAVAYTVSGKSQLAKIGNTKTANSFTYDSTINYYQGGKESDTLVVAGEEDANIWLDGSTGVTYSSIENVTATGSGNVTLAGGSASEQISAGSGDASLWGGIGGNDTLTGGSGTNTFFFGKNNGSDVVTSTSETDRVMLYDVALSDVKSFGETNGAMVIALNDGSKLTVNSVASGTTFQTTDGAWSYDTTTQTWANA